MVKNTIIILLIIAVAFFVWDYSNNKGTGEITNFKECADAGNSIFESYPRQCKVNGKTFVEEIAENKKLEKEPEINDSLELTSGQDEVDFDSEEILNDEEKSISTSTTAEENKENNKNAVVESDEIKVFDIGPGSTLTSPVEIRGEGVAFENTLIVELRNNNHVALVQEIANIKSSDVGIPGPFKITINFSFQNTKEGFLAVYEESAKDGSEQHLVEIPVKFSVDTE